MSFSLVQEAHDFSFPSSVATFAKAFGSNVTVGDLLIVWLAAVVSGGTIAVSDSQGNTYTRVGSQLNAGFGDLAVFWAIAGSTGANTVTFSRSGGNLQFPEMQVLEFSGNIASPFDAGGSNTGSNAVPLSNVTATGSADLVIGVCIPTSGLTLTAGAGWTQVGTNFGAIYKFESASGTFTPTFTMSANGAWGVIAAAFKSPVVASAKPTVCIMQ